MNVPLRAGLFAALVLVIAGCTGAPGTPAPGEPGQPGTDAALANLCDPTNEAGLTMLATELEGVNETTDTTTLNTLIGTAMTQLQAAQVAVGEATVRDAAVTALGQAQTALDDPATRTAAAQQAAAALRTAQGQLCQ